MNRNTLIMDNRSDLLEAILADVYEDSLLNDAYQKLSAVTEDNPESQIVVNETMTALAEGLFERRADSSDQEWTSFVQLANRHPLKELLHQDPFTKRACEKPRGYAGDAELLDYVYGREDDRPEPADVTPLGRLIFRYTTGAPASAGSRDRRAYVAGLLDRLVSEVRRPEVLSIASGHLREASLSSAVKRRKLGRFLALDSDAASLEECLSCYGKYGVEAIPSSIRQLLTRDLDVGKFDLVYSTGLFDYLQQATSQRLTQKMFDLLRPGGMLVIANVLPGIRDVGYMECFMDWKLVYRTRQEMMAITMNIPQTEIRDIRMFTEENENIIFLEVVRK